MDTELYTVSGKFGIPAGAVRLYARGGGVFHRATRVVTQTNDPLNFDDPEGNPVMVPGGDQTFEVETDGWAWLAGGGIEGWVSPRFALFGDASFFKLDGRPTKGTNISMDGRVFNVLGGIRLKVF
jgi:hypothetical protein